MSLVEEKEKTKNLTEQTLTERMLTELRFKSK